MSVFGVDLKYVVVETGHLRQVAIIFENGVTHARAAGKYYATGAGFFRVVNGKVCVEGHSESLRMDAKPEDAEPIQRLVDEMTRSLRASK